MLRLDDMEIFVEVVRQNSLRKAAEKLKIPVSTLSRRLSVNRPWFRRHLQAS